MAARIDPRGYPARQPLHAVRREFASWDVDHSRFEVRKQIGKGTFGSVCLALDHATVPPTPVAIKRIGNRSDARHRLFRMFESAKLVYRELKILRLLRHPNIVKLLYVSCPGVSGVALSADGSRVDLSNFEELYLYFEILDCDLGNLVLQQDTPLTDQHIRWFMFRALTAVKCMHAARIIHRDIKPANFVINSQNEIKLCDFGFARTIDEENDGLLLPGVRLPMEEEEEEAAGGAGGGGGASSSSSASSASSSSGSAAQPAPPNPLYTLTKRVQTRYYRAPELPLYNDGRYTSAIDVWSLGCCFAEMLSCQAGRALPRQVLLQGRSCAVEGPGAESAWDQLGMAVQVLGPPTPAQCAALRTPEARERAAAKVAAVAAAGYPAVAQGPALAALFPEASAPALELLGQMLCFVDTQRIGVDAALAHPYLAELKSNAEAAAALAAAAQQQPVAFGSITPENVRGLIVGEIRQWCQQIPEKWEAAVAADRAAAAGGGGGGGGGGSGSGAGSAMQ